VKLSPQDTQLVSSVTWELLSRLDSEGWSLLTCEPCDLDPGVLVTG
jgi:hypothetical protein